eukprot:CAMPEP_0180512706 /NCGR_PEP_ID=MMETSP1036_2-20121128/51739_1 /TAXON_ID=632150 /ORGANISM="Azadinium spinosum, Strain 3D9" /LENGTH=48 /DNA_ID= /DNA_START= /DNA_END= /DNA_ORIENTATION=
MVSLCLAAKLEGLTSGFRVRWQELSRTWAVLHGPKPGATSQGGEGHGQ